MIDGPPGGGPRLARVRPACRPVPYVQGVSDTPPDGEPVPLLAVVREGAVLRGLAGPQPAKVLQVTRLTDDSANVVYRTESGGLGERMVFPADLPALTAVEAGASFAFDGHPPSFKLAAEARRMRLAHLFDPQAALGTSDVDPLPHQLRAVYEEMLPRHPLRYVLADDPGAGKTIMAGLLVKELLMRGDAQNILVVAPGSLVDQWGDEMREKFGLSFQPLTKDVIDQGGNRSPAAGCGSPGSTSSPGTTTPSSTRRARPTGTSSSSTRPTR